MALHSASILGSTEDGLRISLEGRVEASNARDFENDLIRLRRSNPSVPLVIDAKGLEYISSAGLRALMRLRKAQGAFTIVNVTAEVYDIFEVTGFTQLLDVRRAMPEISLEGKELIGAGANGRVYRLDEERIVKVYNPVTNPPEKIFREKQVARQAFIQGVPSALSFEMVRVGEGYGIIYEMIDAQTLGEVTSAHPERLEEYATRMAMLLRELHATEFAPGTLPDARDSLHIWVDIAERSGYYGAKVISAAHDLVDSIPPANTFIHGDFHPANIMVTEDDEFLLIDMGDASVGDPIIDLLGSFQIMRLVADRPGGAERYTGLSSELLIRMWETFIRAYLGTADDAQVEAFEQKLRLYVLIRSLPGVTFSDVVPEEKREKATAMLGAALLEGMRQAGLLAV